MICLKLIQQGNTFNISQDLTKTMSFFRKKFPSEKISDNFLKNKYKRIETLLKSMQFEVCDERPDCYQVLEERDEWITSLDNIKETDEYEVFVNQLNNISINDESLAKYVKYHFELN